MYDYDYDYKIHIQSNRFNVHKFKYSVHLIFNIHCLLVWFEGKALDYLSGGHAFKPCHRSYTKCIAG